MESLKRLEQVLKECLGDIKTVESKVSITDGNLAFLESKKTSLTAEIADLETKKASVQESIGAVEREARNRMDDQAREVRLKEEQVLSDRAVLKTRIYEAESAKADAEGARVKYAAQYAEYLEKSQELENKIQSILAAAGK